MLSDTDYPKHRSLMTAAEKAARTARIVANYNCFHQGRFAELRAELARAHNVCAPNVGTCKA